MCIQLLLVLGLLSAFGFLFLLPREFSGLTPHFSLWNDNIVICFEICFVKRLTVGHLRWSLCSHLKKWCPAKRVHFRLLHDQFKEGGAY